MNTIENVFHFLSQCSFYNDERTELFSNIKNANGNFVFLNNIDKATWLLLQKKSGNSTSTWVLYKLLFWNDM